MIVGTHFGLFMPALRPNWQTLEDGQPELQVRSRRRVDLLNLKKFMEDIGLVLEAPFQIPHTDYQWRAYCTRSAWGLALLQIAQEMDYTKFKDTPQKYHGDDKLTDAYGKIWNATLRAFPTGSFYGPREGRTKMRGQRPALSLLDETRVAETVYRTENREWRMKGASPKEIADLMREIDSATEGVTLPTDAELEQVASDIERQPLWLQKEVLRPLVQTGPTEVNGHLDHSHCTHNPTASARRKCRKRFYRDN